MTTRQKIKQGDIQSLADIPSFKQQCACYPNCPPGAALALNYARQSAGDEDPIAAQTGASARFVSDASRMLGREFHLVGTVTDKTSAWTRPDQEPPYRPGWEGLREARRLGLVSLFTARELSRFSRDPYETQLFIRECRRSGIEIYTAMEHHITGTDLGTAMNVAVKTVMNDHESAIASRRMRENRRELMECGFYTSGKVQVGWRMKGETWVEVLDGDGSVVRKKHVPKYPRVHRNGLTYYGRIAEPTPEARKAVREIYQSVVTKGGTLADVSQILDKHGLDYRSKYGANHTRIRYLLGNPILVGYLTYYQDRTDPGPPAVAYVPGRERLRDVLRDPDGVPLAAVDPVLSMTEFLELSDALTRMLRRNARRDMALIAGVGVCGRCGSTLTRNGNAAGMVYTCRAVKLGLCGGVGMLNRRADPIIEQLVLDRFSPEELEATVLAYENQNREALAQLPSAHADEVAELQGRLADVAELIVQQSTRAGREALQRKFDQLASRIDELTLRVPAVPVLGNVAAVTNGYDLREAWPTLDPNQKNAVIREAVEHVLIKPVGKGRWANRTPADRIVIWWRGEPKPEGWPPEPGQ